MAAPLRAASALGRRAPTFGIPISAATLQVLHADDHIVVVNKPAGVLCVPGRHNPSSLASAVFEKFGNEAGSLAKSVVHRLDADTSGIVVFARPDMALRKLHAAFRERRVEKIYEALQLIAKRTRFC